MNSNVIPLVYLYNWVYDYIRLITAGVVYDKQCIILNLLISDRPTSKFYNSIVHNYSFNLLQTI